MHTAQDSSILVRWSNSLKEAVEKAQSNWSTWRIKKTQTQFFNAALDEIKNACVFLQMIARALDMDLTAFKGTVSLFEDFQIRVSVGQVDIMNFSPSVLGKVSMALKDIRTASLELIEDARELHSLDETSYDYLAFGTDLGIIAGAVSVIAKAFRLNDGIVKRMRNTILTHFRVMSGAAFESVPPSGSVVEVPAEAITFASWVRRATIETRRNPVKAAAMLDGILKATEK